MAEDYVNLTVNPCNMCMPMGVVNAFYGIRGAMTILHGSQGCSTYIRRHMATHYNEPIDIASSSLTEQGTVYGGEKNLIKGLENLIKLYDPEVIAIATTCLAETIGEDVARISKTFYETHDSSKVKLIPVPSPGYGGSQYEGYFRALRAIVENTEMNEEKNNKINIITSPISPADTRELKEILEAFEIDYILLPDIADNLDAPRQEKYNRLPSGGTSINDIALMAGAKATIELSTLIKEEYSAGRYLEDTFGVKNYRLNIPRGLRDTDEFINLLQRITGREIPKKYKEQRGRYIDAMIDSHKYNAEARVVIYGEPDFVYSTARLCLENGSMPVLLATGSKCQELKELLDEELKELSEKLFAGEYKILDNTDFKNIEKYALELNANLMIGSSDGRRIEEKHGIPLVRMSFPIHDRIGGQRLMTLAYEGSIKLMDSITNSILEAKEKRYRKSIYDKFYKEEGKVMEKKSNIEIEFEAVQEETKISIEEKTKTHPCFSCGSAHKYARIHLPIAPKCNISCNYCLRKYDCPNESRPGVTTEILSPIEALEKYKYVKSKMDNLTVVGIAGPGDSLANFEQTKRTLQLIKNYDKDVTFCLSTNGLMLPFYANDLVELGVTHVTITINAVDPKIGAKVYKYVDYLGTKYIGEEAAEILLNNQLLGLKFLTSKGIVCKINIVMLKGINDEHIEEVVKKVKEYGATITNIMQLIPVKGSVFEDMPLVSNVELMNLRKKCGEHIEQMYHCKQCRADAIGTLENDQSIKFRNFASKEEENIEKPALRFAVASKSGMLVDKHFGHVSDFYIYEYKDEIVSLIEKRKVDKYCNGVEECDDEEDKITKIMRAIEDCNGVLALRIGDMPLNKLKSKGIEVFITYERIEKAVKNAAEEVLIKNKEKEISNIKEEIV
ncbi:nitrogenase cofactor biosynthesis protein NifB [Clostridium sp. 'White wine YQ']|uniref:nitrogenase cofactor biosynthesis protein NifB n=1 Tax=Clostridium sp. 'White wine YQ' TaxID=3027474 RepID=UPI002366C4A4|nr:nitrogenase cofactor biosynthesis protein NifB [Clostridium sp. 'White wine YQ']MDD7795627.1 nitrogenase cofactor biosynthesis protein NifB [Clostridium sp. 'White wine YQ']